MARRFDYNGSHTYSEREYDRLMVEKLWTNTMFKEGHWRWINYCDWKGYGRVRYKGKVERVHRISAHIFHNLDLNSGIYQALHKEPCRLRDCWNPDHIYIGTNNDNIKDTLAVWGKFRHG